MSEPTRYDWSLEPFVLEIKDIARILRRSVRVIRGEISRGTMAPPPMPKVGKTTAYQWSRVDVQDWLEGGYRKHDPIGARRARAEGRTFFGKARPKSSVA